MKTHDHNAVSERSQALLRWAALLTALTFGAELAGGLWTNSVALLSDAGHVFMDLAALLFSLFALRLADLPATDRRSWGLHRLEVFAAFLNGALVTAVAAWIVLESLQRLKSPPPVKTGPMLVLAVLGLLVNLLVAWRLHDFARKDVNIRGAFLHVAGDALASLGVVAAGALIHFTGALVLDPLAGLLVAGIIVVNALRLLKDSIDILLEGVPKHMDLNEVVAAIRSVPGVAEVEDTHVWNICSHICSLSAHVILPPEKMPEQKTILENINAVLRERFGVAHATIQMGCSAWKKEASGDGTAS